VELLVPGRLEVELLPPVPVTVKLIVVQSE
jgi:hypothetical protein